MNEKCRACDHPRSHHHPAVGCLNRHCTCKNKQWFNQQEQALRELRAERRR